MCVVCVCVCVHRWALTTLARACVCVLMFITNTLHIIRYKSTTFIYRSDILSISSHLSRNVWAWRLTSRSTHARRKITENNSTRATFKLTSITYLHVISNRRNLIAHMVCALYSLYNIPHYNYEVVKRSIFNNIIY